MNELDLDWSPLPEGLHPEWRELIESYRADLDIQCVSLTDSDRDRLEMLVALVEVDGLTVPGRVLLNLIRETQTKLDSWRRTQTRH